MSVETKRTSARAVVSSPEAANSCINVHAHCAAAIVHGTKRIENRSRPIAPGYYFLRTTKARTAETKVAAKFAGLPRLPLGCVVALVKLRPTKTLREGDREWADDGSVWHRLRVVHRFEPPVAVDIAKGAVVIAIVHSPSQLAVLRSAHAAQRAAATKPARSDPACAGSAHAGAGAEGGAKRRKTAHCLDATDKAAPEERKLSA